MIFVDKEVHIFGIVKRVAVNSNEVVLMSSRLTKIYLINIDQYDKIRPFSARE